MPRTPRIEFEGAHYHVLARGNRRANIVLGDEDRWMFIRTLGEMCARTGIVVHAYALMSNHYHLVLETPQANLVAGMQWFQNTYTRRFNVKNRLWGHLYGGRYKAILVEEKEGDYFQTLIDYVHLNPVRAAMISKTEGFDSYPWTSLREYCKPPSKRFDFMGCTRSFSALNIKDDASGRRKYVERLEQLVDWTEPNAAGKVVWEGQSLQSTLQRGWYFGSQGFRESLLEKFKFNQGNIEEGALDRNSSTFRKDKDNDFADKVIAKGLKVLDVERTDLISMKKNAWQKALLAELITSRTSIPMKWVAEELYMGSSPYVSRLSKEMRTRLAKDEKLSALRVEIVRIIT